MYSYTKLRVYFTVYQNAYGRLRMTYVMYSAICRTTTAADDVQYSTVTKPVNRCECISTSIKGDDEEGTYVEGNKGIIEGHGMIEE